VAEQAAAPVGTSPLHAGRRRLLLTAFAVAAGAAVWLLAAHALWQSSVPSNLKLPHVPADTLFDGHYLSSSRSYELFLTILALLAEIAVIVVLVLYARHGQALMRESAAGPIGTGMLLGMLGFALVWLVEVPFRLLAVWWERKHGVSHEGYVTSVLTGFLGLGGTFVFVSFGLLIVMGLARVSRRRWWLLASPAFAALALLSAFVSPYLLSRTTPLREPQRVSEVRSLASREGLHGVRAEVQDVERFTTAPNAEAVGFGASRRLVLWDTLLDGRFDRREVRVVIAHELGHIAHKHVLKRVGWLLLFLLPASALVALATARLGGLGRPEAVPLALLIFIVLQLAASPLMNLVSRHEEAEADWSALKATGDTAAARSLFVRLARTSHADPDPPAWSYVLFADHPTIVQRVAMVDACQARVDCGAVQPTAAERR
jgi:Zn-dependent protease with chaperone function